jgi:hypothetical protein
MKESPQNTTRRVPSGIILSEDEILHFHSSLTRVLTSLDSRQSLSPQVLGGEHAGMTVRQQTSLRHAREGGHPER